MRRRMRLIFRDEERPLPRLTSIFGSRTSAGTCKSGKWSFAPAIPACAGWIATPADLCVLLSSTSKTGLLPCPSTGVHCCPDDGIRPIGHTQVQPDVRAPELHPAQVLVDQPDPNMLGSLSFPWCAQSLNHSARLSDISRAITASSSSNITIIPLF